MIIINLLEAKPRLQCVCVRMNQEERWDRRMGGGEGRGGRAGAEEDL